MLYGATCKVWGKTRHLGRPLGLLGLLGLLAAAAGCGGSEPPQAGCAPGETRVDGACRAICAHDADCTDGHLCDPQLNVCLPSPPPEPPPPCDPNENDCHENASCVDQEDVYTCVCATGYVGDGREECIDIDECAESLDDCAADYQCINTAGGFDCVCQPGSPCDPPRCDDGAQNGTETGTDCGGSCVDLGLRCDNGKACSDDQDCKSGVCDNGTCQVPSCSDRAENGDETDTDCGGSHCDPCGDSKTCRGRNDCQSGVCSERVCRAPDCYDTVQNGDETDTDCGGSCVLLHGLRCEENASCNSHDDCLSEFCDAAGACRVPTCTDNAQNGDETGTDCGGSCRAHNLRCNEGDGCSQHDDCQSGYCTPEGTCRTPTCTDNAQNGDETGTDCGGSCRAHNLRCEEGGACRQHDDCESGYCDPEGACRTPTCTDNTQNGDETAPDCGGSCALEHGQGCGNFVSCTTDTDCASGYCHEGNTCRLPSCFDGAQGEDETDIDCGGSCGSSCGDTRACDNDSDCHGGFCEDGACHDPSCHNEEFDPGEVDLDCGGPRCTPCPDTKRCDAHDDCQSGYCHEGIGGEMGGECRTPTCDDTVRNGDETGTDCGGSCSDQSRRCADDSACKIDADCESGYCHEGSTCKTPTCSDGVHNGNESDTDCGHACGSDALRCGEGSRCRGDSDCEAGYCAPEGFCQRPTCTDTVHNGDETDTDCGGSCALEHGQGCDNFNPCNSDTDCLSGYCHEDNTCRLPTCFDDAQGEDETDVDCGGGCGPVCGDGETCGTDDDCYGGHCDSGACKVATCHNDQHDPDEIDTDCGGPWCSRCAESARCHENHDCQSGYCHMENTDEPPYGRCAMPACDDTAHNGDETDTDCGGSCGATCDIGSVCGGNADCASDFCFELQCAASSCADGQKDASETDTDCGGTCAEFGIRCGDGKSCAYHDDCDEGWCDRGICERFSCHNAHIDGDESDLNCGGSVCQARCIAGKRCDASEDCESRVCDSEGQFCLEATCDDATTNADETDTDCGGTCAIVDALTCSDGRGCIDDRDCQSGLCDSDSVCQRRDTLHMTESLYPGQQLTSNNGQHAFRVGMQSLRLVDLVDNTVSWERTWDIPNEASDVEVRLTMQGDAHLVAYVTQDGSSTPVWASGTHRSNVQTVKVTLLDDGTLFLEGIAKISTQTYEFTKVIAP